MCEAAVFHVFIAYVYAHTHTHTQLEIATEGTNDTHILETVS